MGAGVLSWSRLISLRAQLHRHIEHYVVHTRQAAFAVHLVCLHPVSPVPRLQLCALRSAPRSPQLRQAKSFPLMSTFTGSPTDSVELDERLLPFLHGLGDSYARPPQLDRERTGVPSNSAMLSGCVSSAPSFPNTLVRGFVLWLFAFRRLLLPLSCISIPSWCSDLHPRWVASLG